MQGIVQDPFKTILASGIDYSGFVQARYYNVDGQEIAYSIIPMQNTSAGFIVQGQLSDAVESVQIFTKTGDLIYLMDLGNVVDKVLFRLNIFFDTTDGFSIIVTGLEFISHDELNFAMSQLQLEADNKLNPLVQVFDNINFAVQNHIQTKTVEVS